MAAHHDLWPVTVLCAVLEGSRSGWYAYLRRRGAARKADEELVLIAQVQAIAAG
jgi:hypothetical protein